jgi:hypothetical protein
VEDLKHEFSLLCLRIQDCFGSEKGWETLLELLPSDRSTSSSLGIRSTLSEVCPCVVIIPELIHRHDTAAADVLAVQPQEQRGQVERAHVEHTKESRGEFGS